MLRKAGGDRCMPWQPAVHFQGLKGQPHVSTVCQACPTAAQGRLTGSGLSAVLATPAAGQAPCTWLAGVQHVTSTAVCLVAGVAVNEHALRAIHTAARCCLSSPRRRTLSSPTLVGTAATWGFLECNKRKGEGTSSCMPATRHSPGRCTALVGVPKGVCAASGRVMP